MKIKVSKSTIKGKIFVPGSKSHTVRALAAALVSNGTSIIRNPLVSDDTTSCLNAIQKLGAKFTEINEDNELIWKIEGNAGKLTNITDEMIDLGNSGTSLRLLTGLAATGNIKICFDGDNSLRGRPMGPLILSLAKLGVKAGASEEGKCPVAVRGPILGGSTVIDGTTSQFISSLLFAAPLGKNSSVIDVININEKPYIELTLEWLDFLGIKYNCKSDYSRFTIRGNQTYTAFDKTIPADFSTATFALAAAAITGDKLKICNLDFTDKQGDKEVFEYLELMGMRVEEHGKNVSVYRKGKLYGDVTLDLNSTPDALPAMAAISCYAKGKTVLGNAPHARFKETDRISAMAKELTKMGAKIQELKDGLVIKGSKLTGTVVNGYNDHRIIMALAIAGMGAIGETVIKNAEAVSVTYPNFIEDFKNIGANIEQI